MAKFRSQHLKWKKKRSTRTQILQFGKRHFTWITGRRYNNGYPPWRPGSHSFVSSSAMQLDDVHLRYIIFVFVLFFQWWGMMLCPSTNTCKIVNTHKIVILLEVSHGQCFRDLCCWVDNDWKAGLNSSFEDLDTYKSVVPLLFHTLRDIHVSIPCPLQSIP